MWENAEVAGLLDRDRRIRVVSRNEDEAVVANVVGRNVSELISAESWSFFVGGYERALNGEEVDGLISGLGDDGCEYWGRVRLMPSPEPEAPVLFHMRRLPRRWAMLSARERDVIQALNDCSMNAKRAAKRLGISMNTLNSHRRSICQKCELHGVGEFWIFVQRCR